ncbi:MAG: hypothetical protein IT371_09545 [Deltaproteobacteria bacterium]|nr:hypothetical protein [Deltaproteobacteria bacterium]
MLRTHDVPRRSPAGLALLGLLCLSLTPGTLRAAPELSLRTSPTHGLFVFVEALSGVPNHSPLFAELFAKSRHDTPEARARLRTYRALRDRFLRGGGRYAGYPEERRDMGWDVARLVKLQSALARDLPDFGGRIATLLPVAEHRQYLELLGSFEPIYRELVWKPSEPRLARYRKALEQLARRIRFPELFAKLARFYGAAWPEAQPVVVVLHPIPAARGRTNATILGPVASVEALVDERDLVGRFGVIVHELCHALYQAQPPERQRALLGAFRRSPSPYAPHAAGLLDEALATAIGNGWVERTLRGTADESWYADEDIDRFAKLLVGRVERYLEAKRPLDEAFVREAIGRVAEKMPDVRVAYRSRLKRAFLATDGETFTTQEGVRQLRRAFTAQSIFHSSPLDHAQTVQAFREAGPEAAVVLVVTPQRRAQLRGLAAAAPPLARWLKQLEAQRGSFVFAAADERQRPWVVVVASKVEELERALAELKRAGKPGARPCITAL